VGVVVGDVARGAITAARHAASTSPAVARSRVIPRTVKAATPRIALSSLPNWRPGRPSGTRGGEASDGPVLPAGVERGACRERDVGAGMLTAGPGLITARSMARRTILMG
jgi:hypothetical protein